MKTLYTKKDCTKCDVIKSKIDTALTAEQIADIRIVDLTDPEPHRKELIRNGAMDAVKKTMPVMVDDDGNVYKGTLMILKKLGIGGMV